MVSSLFRCSLFTRSHSSSNNFIYLYCLYFIQWSYARGICNRQMSRTFAMLVTTVWKLTQIAETMGQDGSTTRTMCCARMVMSPPRLLLKYSIYDSRYGTCVPKTTWILLLLNNKISHYRLNMHSNNINCIGRSASAIKCAWPSNYLCIGYCEWCAKCRPESFYYGMFPKAANSSKSV